MRSAASAIALLACTAPLALAGNGCPDCATIAIAPTELGLDFEYYTFLGSDDPAADLFTVSGQIVLEATDYTSPDLGGSLSLHELTLTLEMPVADYAGSLDFGNVLGTASYTFTLEGASYTGAPIPADEPTEGKNVSYFFSDIPLTLAGSHSTDYEFIAVGALAESGPLSDLGPQSATLTDVNIFSDGQQVTFSGTLSLPGLVIGYEPALVESRVNFDAAVLSGTGDDPHDTGPNFCNRVDLAEPCGILDLADIVAYIQAFQAQDPVADLVEPFEIFDLADLVAFTQTFQQGCPGGADDGPYDCYYIGMNFDEGDAAYALGEHRALTAGLAVGGMALMLGFTALRRRNG